jgi:RNA polymerase sigma-70 factor (ECF subfamily)
MESTDHLFRREAGRMVAVLTRIFGVHNLALVEDVVQDAFCQAMEVWKFRGVPDNPCAWLMATAKNRALDVLRRECTARTYAPELNRLLQSEWTLAPVVQELFAPNEIKDDLLRMMFACCHPRLPEEAKVALMLHILCGFSVDEIAAAFVSSHAAIEKRITRAKKVLAASKTLFDVTAAAEFSTRLPAVQRTLYLLFNEGYHGASTESAVRAELCRDAMRLTAQLLEHSLGKTPATFALAALMCFDAARLPARVDASGNLSSLFDQDRSRWDQGLVVEGLRLLELSAKGTELSEYHVEAAIASIHARALSAKETDWTAIVSLYDTLITLRPSPIADLDRLATYPFYSAALGELEFRCGRHKKASEHFRTAFALARNPMERQFLDLRIGACEGRIIDYLKPPHAGSES